MENFWNLLISNIQHTSPLEFFAVGFGLLSVFFIMKENIWGYPTGLVNVGLYVYLCFKARLFANMGINVFYFIVSIYGWYNWTHPGQNQTHLEIKRLNKKEIWLALASFTLLFLLIWLLLSHVPESSSPFFDALTTAIFIVAMVLQAYKRLETWIFWIAGDVIAIPLFASSGLAFTGLQYLAFFLMAISGFFSWKKSLASHV
ncbi:MAG TPA: nicotinamide riboside transporter PnuC [Bacteroidales bacterium]|jgi:nicotinamide mononucleotide transporter|nr:nicotinamide riboside transporter PnuC [Bacteroidales bacterium]HQQ02866.1 nicotinamide riboside transporter PnuC [Bacteroidales bacterium]